MATRCLKSRHCLKNRHWRGTYPEFPQKLRLYGATWSPPPRLDMAHWQTNSPGKFHIRPSNQKSSGPYARVVPWGCQPQHRPGIRFRHASSILCPRHAHVETKSLNKPDRPLLQPAPEPIPNVTGGDSRRRKDHGKLIDVVVGDAIEVDVVRQPLKLAAGRPERQGVAMPQHCSANAHALNVGVGEGVDEAAAVLDLLATRGRHVVDDRHAHGEVVVVGAGQQLAHEGRGCDCEGERGKADGGDMTFTHDTTPARRR